MVKAENDDFKPFLLFSPNNYWKTLPDRISFSIPLLFFFGFVEPRQGIKDCNSCD